LIVNAGGLVQLRNEEERNFVTAIVPKLVWIMKMAI
jgi:hypothetical protein